MRFALQVILPKYLLVLPIVSAFCPYHPEYIESASSRTGSVSPREGLANQPRHAAPSFPLRRIPTRRTNKYNIVTSTQPSQPDSVAIDQDGTDFSYMVSITIGTGSEEYHLLLDSAASNTWVMGKACTTDTCNAHTTFGKGDSSSLTLSDKTFNIVYGTGQVSGTIATDSIHISSFSPSLTFGLATNVSDDFDSYPMDGILGIGIGESEGNAIAAPSLMDALSTQSFIKAKLFGVHLSRTVDGVNDGELNFGAPDTRRYDGDIGYISTIENPDGFWEISIDDAGVDGQKLGITGRSAIIDSGTSFILMPSGDAEALHKHIPNYTQSGETFTVPCKSTQVVQMVFGGTTYNVSTADYIGGNLGNGACKSNIIGRQTFGETHWLVGDVFLKNVYTVFDFDGKRVGFGVKEDEIAASASSTIAPSSSSTTMVGSTSTGATSTSGTAAPALVSQQSASAPPSTMTGVGVKGAHFILALLAPCAALLIPVLLL